MRCSLLPECLALCRQHAADPDPRPNHATVESRGRGNSPGVADTILERWRLRMHVLGLPKPDNNLLPPEDGIAQADTGHASPPSGLCDTVLPRLMPSTKASVAREGLVALTELLNATHGCDTSHGVGAINMHALLQQALAFAPGSNNPSFLAAAMQLATALAELTCTAPAINSSHVNRGVLAEPLPPPSSAVSMLADSTPALSVAAEPRTRHTAKRRRAQDTEPLTVHEPVPPPHQQHLTPGTADLSESNLEPGELPSDKPPLSMDHAAALHRGLVSWCGHWHPRVRARAVEGLMAAHGGDQAAPVHLISMPRQEPARVGQRLLRTPRRDLFTASANTADVSIPIRYQCSSIEQVESAYNVAVVCLGDDQECVRVSAMALVAALARGHPHMRLPGLRWLQLGLPLAIVDDAVQRLAGCVMDGEAGVRRQALELMADLPRCSVRVKLQLLSKKATIAVASPALDVPTGAVASSQQQARGQGGQGKQSGGGRGRGRGVRGQSMTHWSWCGSAMSRGLDLLDVSVGALVRGSEDEDQQVRVATVRALVSLGAQEVESLSRIASASVITSLLAGSSHNPSGSSTQRGTGVSKVSAGNGGAPQTTEDTGSMRQVLAQCVEHLCDLMQDEIDLVRSSSIWGVVHLMHEATWHQHVNTAEQHAVGAADRRNVHPERSAPEMMQAAGATGPADGGLTVHTSPEVLVLTSEQLSEVFTLLYDPSVHVRRGVREMMGLEMACRRWTKTLVKSLAFTVARALSALGGDGGGEEGQELLGLVRGVARRVQNVARAVAVEIAQLKQKQTKEGGMQGGALSLEGEVTVVMGREHLKVMHALLQGVGDL